MRSASLERIRDECKKSRLARFFFFVVVNAVHSKRKYAIIRYLLRRDIPAFIRFLFRRQFHVHVVYTYARTHTHLSTLLNSLSTTRLGISDFPEYAEKDTLQSTAKAKRKPLVGYLLHNVNVCREKIFPEFDEITFLAHPRR